MSHAATCLTTLRKVEDSRGLSLEKFIQKYCLLSLLKFILYRPRVLLEKFLYEALIRNGTK